MKTLTFLYPILLLLIVCCPSSTVISPPSSSTMTVPAPTQALPTVAATPEQFVTIDGYDPASESIIDPINLWKDYNDRAAGIAAQAHHGDRVRFIKREGDGVLVETTDGAQGWITYWFIKELKE